MYTSLYVVIFYGSKVKSVAYESLIAITSSSANIEHVKAEKTAKNYLDFQLTAYLGYKLGQNSYDAFASCENASAYNNKLQKSLGNDKTSVVYKATSKIFENAKK